jgi:adenylate cyclase
VNIAARLESLADAGGILVSGAVHETVRGRLSCAFEDLGEQSLKNIATPIPAFRVRHNTEITTSVPGGQPLRRTRHIMIAAAALFAVFGLAGGAWLSLGRSSPPPTASATPRTEKPSIAVLPFVNLSGDPAQEYFADGISEEILTALARSPYLKVIARNSSFAFKNKADGSDAGKALGVHYVLEGGVQRSADQMRITAQLIDATTGAHIWADHFDRPAKDIFAVQDEITGIIAARLVANIQKAEVDTMRTRQTNRPHRL